MTLWCIFFQKVTLLSEKCSIIKKTVHSGAFFGAEISLGKKICRKRSQNLQWKKLTEKNLWLNYWNEKFLPLFCEKTKKFEANINKFGGKNMYCKLRIFYRRQNKKVFFSFWFTPESSVDEYVFQQVLKLLFFNLCIFAINVQNNVLWL